MFGRKYYYIVSGLSNIFYESNKNLVALPDFLNHLEESLHGNDFELVKLFFSEIDNRNLINLLARNEKTFVEDGNFTIDELKDFIKFTYDAPIYMQNVIEMHKNKEIESAIEIEKQLTSDYNMSILKIDNSFIRQWFSFELNVRNVLAANNCRTYQIDVESQVVGDNLVVEQLIKSKSKDFGLSKLFPEIDIILKATEQEDIIKQERMLDSLFWNKAGDFSAMKNFTIDNILCFLIRLKIAYRWKNMEGVDGERIFKDILTSLQNDYEMPEEFRA